MASIIDRGGDDPQIPSDVDEGCGTFPVGVKEATMGNDTENHKTEAREDETERGGTAGGGGEEAVEGGGLGQVTAAEGKVKSPILAGKTHEGALAAFRTDADEAKGVCNRCGARVACACACRDNAGSGLTVGIGNITLGRSFGSPQQSKGARSIMSWKTRRTIAVDDDQDGGSDGNRDHGPSWSDGENCRNNGESGLRECRTTAEGSTEDNSEGRRGITAGDAGSNDQCTSGNRRCTSSREMGITSTLDVENGDKARVNEREANMDSEGSVDPPAPHKASLPQSSAQLKSTSGVTSNGGAGCNSDENLQGEEQYSVTVPKSEDSIRLSEQSERHRNNDRNGGAGAFQTIGILEGTQAGGDTVADSEREALVAITRREARQQEEQNSLPIATAADGATAVGATGGIWSSTATDDTSMDSIANVTGVASETERDKIQDERGSTTQASRSPRLPGTFKTTKRLCEALTYAAGDLGS